MSRADHIQDEVPTTHQAEAQPGHDLAHEAEHARQHAVENIWFFVGFFTLILFAVGSYEFSPNWKWLILLLAAFRVTLIAIFMAWLFGSFSLVIRTFVFTVVFFCGMVSLSIWDSDLHTKFANPIKLPDKMNSVSH